MPTLEFTVPGIPRPGGSKRHIGRGILIDAGRHTKQWRSMVIDYAIAAAKEQGWTAPAGPLRVGYVFHMPRPKHHTNQRGLKASAPYWHTARPDATKLIRAAEDALTEAGLWSDDSVVASQGAVKVYAAPGTFPRAEVRIETLEEKHGGE